MGSTEAGGGTDMQRLVGHVRPACGEKPPRAFRQADDAIGMNTLTYEPPHGPDTNAFSPTHISRSCQASIYILPHRGTHPFAPPGRAAENPELAASASVTHLPRLLADCVRQGPLVQPASTFVLSTRAQMCAWAQHTCT